MFKVNNINTRTRCEISSKVSAGWVVTTLFLVLKFDSYETEITQILSIKVSCDRLCFLVKFGAVIDLR